MAKVPSDNNKKRPSRNKDNSTSSSRFCPCGGDSNTVCDRKSAFDWLVKLCGVSTNPPGVLVKLNLKQYEQKIIKDQEATMKKDFIFSLPLFCLVCQRMIGEGIRGILAEEVKVDKKGRNWHQLLARAHEDHW